MENEKKIKGITKVLIVFLVLFVLWTVYTLSKAEKETCPTITTTTEEPTTTTTTTEAVTTTTEAIICPAAPQNTPEKPGYKCIMITEDEKTYSAWCEKEEGYFGI